MARPAVYRRAGRAAFRWAGPVNIRFAAALAIRLAALLLAVVAGAHTAAAQHELSGRVAVESRWFPQTAAHDGQRSYNAGLVAEPKLYLQVAGSTGFTLAPFFRTDAADPARTHGDLREAYLLLSGPLGGSEWELRLGVDRVFWGVAEARHLVDIVNQTDLVDHPNEKTKLGQPMAHLTFSGDWGAAELFAISYHRLRPFPGRAGRLRPEFRIDNDLATYESGAKEWHLDFAARYSHSFGPLDLGLSVFDGTSREPVMRPVVPDRSMEFRYWSPVRTRPALRADPAVRPRRPAHRRGLAAQAGGHSPQRRQQAVSAQGRRTTRPSWSAANTPSTASSRRTPISACLPNG